MACELHDGMRADMERLRDDIAGLNAASHDQDARLRELAERDRFREDAITKLEATTEKGQARLEGLIQALATQISTLAKEVQELKNARAQKLATRWDDVVGKVMGWIVTAALGAAAAWIISKGGKP